MRYYIEQIKNWKNIPKLRRRWLIADMIRSIIFMLLGVGLYLVLHNTGLLLYIIFMLKWHWSGESK